ncbi:hypothetical protein AX17_004087 [Amanita inopinata Kibby_2008]|nr:hypothetical protein AX17_004087 [Amanita inopinata Kibby_2008]
MSEGDAQAANLTDKPQGVDTMDVDVAAAGTDAATAETDTMKAPSKPVDAGPVEDEEEVPTYTSIEAPPSVWPQKHYCDITGLEAPYTDPATGLRFHDKSVYEIVKGLSASTVKDYLVARGVSTVVK